MNYEHEIISVDLDKIDEAWVRKAKDEEIRWLINRARDYFSTLSSFGPLVDEKNFFTRKFNQLSHNVALAHSILKGEEQGSEEVWLEIEAILKRG